MRGSQTVALFLQLSDARREPRALTLEQSGELRMCLESSCQSVRLRIKHDAVDAIK